MGDLEKAVERLRRTVEEGQYDAVELALATRALDDLVQEMWAEIRIFTPDDKADDEFAGEEFEEVDSVIYALAQRRGAGAFVSLSARKAHQVYKNVAKFVQSVLDSRTDMNEIDIEEPDAAAVEKDPRKAFWMYVSRPTFATNEKDFINRVLPAVRDLPLDDYGRAQWAEEFGHIPVPEAATYEHALAVVLA